MVNDTNNQFKRQYLTLLEQVVKHESTLSKCISVITIYDILYDSVMVKSCIRIFKEAPQQNGDEESIYISLYCILLISLVHDDNVQSDEKRR